MAALRVAECANVAAARAKEILVMSVSAMERAARFGNPAWRFVDLSGQRFGKLLVLHRDGTDIGGHARWVCACDCGRCVVVDGTTLRLRRVVSCTCFMRQRHRERPMIYSRARRITRLGVKKARALTTAIHSTIGLRALDTILANFSSRSHELPASRSTRKGQRVKEKL